MNYFVKDLSVHCDTNAIQGELYFHNTACNHVILFLKECPLCDLQKTKITKFTKKSQRKGVNSKQQRRDTIVAISAAMPYRLHKKQKLPPPDKGRLETRK
jgi:hypothetical protein